MNRLPTVIAVFLVCAIGVKAQLTAQPPEKIYIEGQEYVMYSTPMDAYFEKFPGKSPLSWKRSGSLVRGYVATFEIEKGTLYLKDIQVPDPETLKKAPLALTSALNKVVPTGERLKVDWFTGLLVVPYGRVVSFVNAGYGSTHENYNLIEVVAGEVKGAKQLGYRDYLVFRNRQWEDFKKTPEYKKLHQEGATFHVVWDDKTTDAFIRTWLLAEYTSRILKD